MNDKKFRLPGGVRRVLRLIADEELLRSVEDDLEDRFLATTERYGHRQAGWRYRGQILILILSFVIEEFIWRLSMLKNYWKVALRHFRRRKVYSIIKILGLVVGMSSFILIGLWVRDELSFDRFHRNRDRIFRILNAFPDGNSDYNITFALGPALVEQYPEVEAFSRVRVQDGVLLKYREKDFASETVCLADPGFFKVFSFPFIKGDPEKALADRYAAVLSEETAVKFFGTEDPLGKVLRVAQIPGDFMVTGVVKNPPANSTLRFDIAARIEFLGEDRLARWEEWTGPTYVLLRPGVERRDFESAISDIYVQNLGPEATYKPLLQPLSRVHLYEYGRPGQVKKVTMFSVIAVFILLMACINFMNLETAQSGKRALEVGMRKVIGADRGQIVRQFLSEAVLITCVSVLLSLLVVEVVLPRFNLLTGKSLQLFSGVSLSLVLVITLVALGTGLLSGSYPALFLSAFHPSQILKGRFRFGRKGAGLRRALIVSQFVISAGLICCTLVVSSQLRFIQHRDIGLDREHIVVLNNNPLIAPRFDALKSDLLGQPGVRRVTTGAQPPNRVGENIQIDWEGNPTENMISADYTVVDYDFFSTFDLDIIRGRSFSREFPTDERSGCVINETAAERMGLEDPLSVEIYMNHPAWPESFRSARVIGVVRDFHSRSLHTPIRPFVFRMYKPWQTYLFIKVEGADVKGTLAGIEKIFKNYAPGFPFRFEFLDDIFNRQYLSESQLVRLFNVFSGLSIFIACLGLFGMASFLAEQKTKEIGVRKVLGASISGIVTMTAREFVKWVTLANLIAWPVASFVMHGWLQDYAYRIQMKPWIFLGAGGFTLGVALVTVSYHALKAALADPVKSLRYE